MGINVLSLFDGISCGMVALERAGIPVKNYYSSEIDKFALKISKKNYPEIIRLGDVRDYKTWDLPKIDLVFAGPPCQGFSFAGRQLNWDDPRSQLFYHAIEIIHDLKPKFFLVETAGMKKTIRQEINEYLDVEFIEINSALVSAQNRKRPYWTNIPGVKQPADRGIFLADIIDSGFVDREKSLCLTANYGNERGNVKYYYKKKIKQIVFENASEICTNPGGIRSLDEKVGAAVRRLTPGECEKLQTLPENFTLVLDKNGKQAVSDTQRYKAIGNGWTIDIIVEMLVNLKKMES